MKPYDVISDVTQKCTGCLREKGAIQCIGLLKLARPVSLFSPAVCCMVFLIWSDATGPMHTRGSLKQEQTWKNSRVYIDPIPARIWVATAIPDPGGPRVSGKDTCSPSSAPVGGVSAAGSTVLWRCRTRSTCCKVRSIACPGEPEVCTLSWTRRAPLPHTPVRIRSRCLFCITHPLCAHRRINTIRLLQQVGGIISGSLVGCTCKRELVQL